MATSIPNIRPAKCEDLAQVQALYRQLRPGDSELSVQQAAASWQSIISDSRTCIVVAEVAGQLASTCAVGVNLSLANGARPFAVIEHVVTCAKFRRQGLSKRVLQFAIDWAWQQDCYKILLLSGEQLTQAHKLYQSVGFKAGIERGFVLKPN
ncbi:GNAT family N-acetyltransferase [Motilimonas pumila]|uniref:GNAT family N-acetyltransferase n=1 Tax=Motilimonas pumila TaxID=2303987 RepID=A0A418YFP7_9GAMM|nr:GNAT family N-acetyltransferase [Motilimonas pumila]RJG48203.1 GNAT family N-acetyltransferase [Motilimonas pumila]